MTLRLVETNVSIKTSLKLRAYAMQMVQSIVYTIQ